MQHVWDCMMDGQAVPRPMFFIDRYHAWRTVMMWFVNNKNWFIEGVEGRAGKRTMTFLLVQVRTSLTYHGNFQVLLSLFDSPHYSAPSQSGLLSVQQLPALL